MPAPGSRTGSTADRSGSDGSSGRPVDSATAWTSDTPKPTKPSDPPSASGSPPSSRSSRRSPPATTGTPAARWDTDWQRRLFDGGYAGLSWPEEYGGRDLPSSQQLIFLEETTRARAPYVGVNFVGLLHAGPTIVAEGTEEQKREHLPRILRGDEVWCQGFSEPGAGSDLASLRTRAVRDGDCYVVTGQKIWCSFGQVGDFGELLVRTDPEVKKQAGITWLMLPMDLPGIEVRPLRTVLGSSEFAELFLDEVRVPVSCRVGEENDGWRVTNVTLSFERGHRVRQRDGGRDAAGRGLGAAGEGPRAPTRARARGRGARRAVGDDEAQRHAVLAGRARAGCVHDEARVLGDPATAR